MQPRSSTSETNRAILAAVSGPTSTLSSNRLPFGSLLQTEIQIHVFEYADSMNMSSNTDCYKRETISSLGTYCGTLELAKLSGFLKCYQVITCTNTDLIIENFCVCACVCGALEVPFKSLYDITVCAELISVGLKVCL